MPPFPGYLQDFTSGRENNPSGDYSNVQVEFMGTGAV
jgi:hypothetical protein